MKHPKYIAQAYLNSGVAKTRLFATEAAKDRWCNRFGAQHPEAFIEVYEVDNIEQPVETWAS